MSSRKQTPDVLGEILGGLPTDEAPQPSQKKRATAARQPRTPSGKAKPRPEPTPPPQWEYMEVLFRDLRGWRPRVINGREQGSWQDAPLLHDYLEQVGAEGWELVNITAGQRFQKEAYFKRVKCTP